MTLQKRCSTNYLFSSACDSSLYVYLTAFVNVPIAKDTIPQKKLIWTICFSKPKINVISRKQVKYVTIETLHLAYRGKKKKGYDAECHCSILE